jgi:hypothetical protein
MPHSFVQAEWENLCHRLQRSAECLGSRAPQLADSFQQQAEDFCRKDVPGQYPELLDRVRSAADLAKRWQQQCEPDEDDFTADNSPEAAADEPYGSMEAVDEVLAESFPASDPPAWTTAAI